MSEEKDKMEEIEKLDERLALEKESIPTPESTIEACIDKAHRLAAKIKASGLVKLEGANFENVTKIAKGIDDALADAKCKVDCITITGDVVESAENLEAFASKCETMLGQVSAAKVEAAEKLYSLSDAVMRTANLDMKKVDAHVHRITAESVRKINAAIRPLEASENVEAAKSVEAEVDKKEITKNLTNLVNKSKTNQKLDTLVDWNSAGISKTMQVGKLTLDDLQRIIVNVKGGKE